MVLSALNGTWTVSLFAELRSLIDTALDTPIRDRPSAVSTLVASGLLGLLAVNDCLGASMMVYFSGERCSSRRILEKK